MNKKHRRVLWLLNHKTLMNYEVPLLVELGFEVFVPKILPQAATFRSSAVNYEWDSTLSISDDALNALNKVNFYERNWSPDVVRVINQCFGSAFIMPYGVQALEALRHFRGQVMFRAFGLDNGFSYRAVLDEMHGMEVFERIKSAGNRFWFAVGYDQLKECEPDMLAQRALFLPIGLPSSYWHHKGTWRGDSGKILFICPNLVTNPYYADIYTSFKSEFGHLPHVIVGAQDAPVSDPEVRGFVSDQELIELYQTSAALYYPSRERRHLHYSPIEAMIVGTPVVFHDDCLLARLAGKRPAGAVKDHPDALEKLTALIEKHEGVSAGIVADQEVIPSKFSHDFCKPQWELEIQRSGLGGREMRDSWSTVLIRKTRRLSRIFQANPVSDLEEGRERVSRRELLGNLAPEGDPSEGIDFTLKELPLFLSLVEGLSFPDSWGRWSDGPRIRLGFEKPLRGRIKMEIQGGAHEKNLNCPIPIKCGEFVETISFSSPPWEPEIQIVHFNLKRPCSIIELTVPHPTVLVEGQRKIGIGLCKLRFLTDQPGRKGSIQIPQSQIQPGNIPQHIQNPPKTVIQPEETSLMNRVPKCIICGFSAPKEIFRIRESECVFGGGRLERYECPECGGVFGPQKMIELSPEMLAREYDELYSTYSESDSTDNEIRAFYALSPKKGGLYLNYGAGAWSKSVPILCGEGFDVLAYDPFHTGGHPDFLTTAELKKYKFDGIYSNNVIEHFPKPVEEFLFLRSLLKPGGSMSHATPCFDHLYEHTRFHTVFFTGKSAEVLAAKTNLRLGERVRDREFICQVFHSP